MFKGIVKLADISSRGGNVPPIYLYLVWILPGFAYSVDVTGSYAYIPFLLISISIMPLIAATNLFDDYFDYTKGYDRVNSPNTIYRRHPVYHYGVTKAYLIRWAAFFSVIYLSLSFILSLRYGLILNLIALSGFVLGYGYTGPPLGYKYLGLGEVGVFLSTIAASELISVAVTGHYYLTSLIYFVPFSLIISLLLFIGNYRDLESDREAGFRTLAVALGRKGSELFSVAVIALFYAFLVVLAISGIYTILSLVDLITAPFALYFSFSWFRRDSARFEKFAGPFLFGILFILIVLLMW